MGGYKYRLARGGGGGECGYDVGEYDCGLIVGGWMGTCFLHYLPISSTIVREEIHENILRY